tara:strand:- start:1128 stop:2081 length:954 start_codon:yes stop_codon:yes gene_type:complete
MNTVEEDLIWHDLSKETPCKTKKKATCESLNLQGLNCTWKKAGNSKACVSSSGKKKSNEENFDSKVLIPTIYSLLKSDNPLSNILDFRDILQHAFNIADDIKKGKSNLKRDFSRNFILSIYHFYIVNFQHWNHSPKIATSLLQKCEKNVPALWFESKELKEERQRICNKLDELVKSVIETKTSACSANEEDQFDFEKGCYLDMVSGECLENKVIVNQIRKTEKGMYTECYNPSTANKLQVDPFTRERFIPYEMKRPPNVDPIKSCTKRMTKAQCEEFCRDQKYTDERLARCLIQNSHWSKDISVFQKVKKLLQFTHF